MMKISLFGVFILRGTVYSLTIHYYFLLQFRFIATEGSDKSEFGGRGVYGAIEISTVLWYKMGRYMKGEFLC